MTRLSIKRIVEIAAAHEGLPVEALTGDGRSNDLVVPRHRMFLVARTLRPDMSYPELGRRTGGKDHTTVLNGVRRARQRATTSADEAAALSQLLALCRAAASSMAEICAHDWSPPAQRPGLERLERSIRMVSEILEDLTQARDRFVEPTGDLFEQRAA